MYSMYTVQAAVKTNNILTVASMCAESWMGGMS